MLSSQDIVISELGVGSGVGDCRRIWVVIW